MQTSKDVIDGLLRDRPVERMGLHEFIWEDALRKWAEEDGYPKGADDKPVPPEEFFGLDMINCTERFESMPLIDHNELLEETDEWEVKRNGAGAAFKYWKNKSGTPEHIDFKMNSREVWEKDYRPHLLEVDRKRLDTEKAKKKLEKRKSEGFWTYYSTVHVWEQMRSSLGDICMYESLLADPDWIHDYNRVYTDFYNSHYKVLIEEAGKPDGIWLCEDLGFNKGLFCSPAVLEELIFPYYKETVDFFHSYDLPVVLHSCGGITEGLPLIMEAGFDALHPMEAKAGCDVIRFAEQYGDRIVFVGGLDERIIESGDQAQIRDGIVRIIKAMRNLGARYVFSSDHSISTNVRLSDYKYALEVCREHMMY